jgi:carbon-monoxide dehydrogenase medium subunit
VKPSPFAYTAPESLDEALAVLGRVGGDGKVLAGGQSLIPILNMRLAAPAHLVDVNRVPGLAYVRTEPDAVHVGALARHADATTPPPAPSRCSARRCGWWRTRSSATAARPWGRSPTPTRAAR